VKVQNIDEHEDGSATLVMDMTNEEVRTLVEYAIIELLKKFIADTGKNKQWID
jgi:hypothetical protein